MQQDLLEVSKAREKILAIVGERKPDIEKDIPLAAVLGRTLAENIYSAVDVPPKDNSAMDGYALHTDSLKGNTTRLAISQRIPAGQSPGKLKQGTAARIFTGAEVPEGANAVVMQENCDAADGSVTINQVPAPTANIRPQGQDIRQGQCVLSTGQGLRPEHLGLIASIGVAKVACFKPLNVTVFSTGDELLEPGEAPAPGKIYNSNQSMLVSLLETLGCRVKTVDTVADTFAATRQALAECAAESDLLVTTGGVSVGEEDHIKDAVSSLGELQLWKVKIKPGKPVAFGHIDRCCVVGLPGNPVSAYVTALLFAVPLVRKLQGQSPLVFDGFSLPADFSVSKARKRPEYARARISQGRVELHDNQSSGVLSSVCWGEALALIPADTTINPGDPVKVFPYANLIHA